MEESKNESQNIPNKDTTNNITGVEVFVMILITTFLLVTYFFPDKIKSYGDSVYSFIQKYSMELLLASLVVGTVLVTAMYFYERFSNKHTRH